MRNFGWRRVLNRANTIEFITSLIAKVGPTEGHTIEISRGALEDVLKLLNDEDKTYARNLLRPALAELVACKDLKEKAEEAQAAFAETPEYQEYRKRQPVAWNIARAVLKEIPE